MKPLFLISMYESSTKQLTAIATSAGFVTVTAKGEVKKVDTIDEVESEFLIYFYSNNSLAFSEKFLTA